MDMTVCEISQNYSVLLPELDRITSSKMTQLGRFPQSISTSFWECSMQSVVDKNDDFFLCVRIFIGETEKITEGETNNRRKRCLLRQLERRQKNWRATGLRIASEREERFSFIFGQT